MAIGITDVHTNIKRKHKNQMKSTIIESKCNWDNDSLQTNKTLQWMETSMTNDFLADPSASQH